MDQLSRFWPHPTTRCLSLLIIGWLLASGIGLGMFWHYKNTGHEPLPKALCWPKQNELLLANEQQTLVMFTHPRCPCTMASLRELTRVLQKSAAQPHVAFVLYQPASAGPEWQTSPLVDAVHTLPGAEIVWDREGQLAKQFTATTSGQVQLYDPRGKCLFNGGVTRSRGHEGECAASRALLAALQGKVPAMISGPAYGCTL